MRKMKTRENLQEDIDVDDSQEDADWIPPSSGKTQKEHRNQVSEEETEKKRPWRRGLGWVKLQNPVHVPGIL